MEEKIFKMVMSNIEKRNTVFISCYIRLSCAVGINSKRYLGDCFLKFLGDKVFLWNYLL